MPGKIPKNVGVIFSSVAKVLVGELTEEAKRVQLEEAMEKGKVDDEGRVELGPISPRHLEEARRRLMDEGRLIAEKPKGMFRK